MISESRKAWLEANKEKLKEYGKKYRKKNKERIDEKNKRWHEANPDKNREYKSKYRENNRDAHNAKNREYYHENIEKERLRTKRYQEKNPKVGTERSKRWNRNNPEKAMLARAKSRAKRRGIEFDITLEDILIPSHCPVLKIPLAPTNGKMHDNSPSLDRIDSTKGYVRGNVIVISWRANMIKNVGTVEEHLKIGNFFHHLLWRAELGQHLILSAPTDISI